MNNEQQHIGNVAEESLFTFKEIADAAATQLAEARLLNPAGSIANNTFTGAAAEHEKARIRRENDASYHYLQSEPAIARVVVVDENGQSYTYYICRTAPVVLRQSQSKLASYRSGIGRLASLPIGEEFNLTLNGQRKLVEVVEFARFEPKRINAEWDARNSVLQGENFGPLTVDSFRKLLLGRTTSEIDENALDLLLAQEDEASNTHEGLRRTVISRMDLRDQPVLDRYQDEIFRLPLDSKLLILGAPGTGKTTTLIRRLGQKLDWQFLEESEKNTINRSPFRGRIDHAHSWIMFTPTELLKLYVKEAFNREGIPAPDERISTWADFRDSLARAEFGILRSASRGGTFIMKQNAQTITAKTLAEPIEWFADFDRFQRHEFLKELRASAEIIRRAPNAEVAQIARRVLSVIESAGSLLQPDSFVSFVKISPDVVPLVNALREAKGQFVRR